MAGGVGGVLDNLGPDPFLGGSWFPFGGGVSGPARDLTSAWLQGSAGPGEEPISSRFPLPAGTITMKVKERWGGGRGLDSLAPLPCGLG